MKILILAPGRCGSTVLAEALQNRYNFNKWISEPFNKDVSRYNDKEWNEFDWNCIEENTIVKCIVNIWHIPEGENNPEGAEKFFDKFAKSFDKVFLLTRDLHSQRLFSVLHAHQYDTWAGGRKYERQEIILDDHRHDEFIQDYINTEIIMYQLAKKYDIINYEKLFNKDRNVSKEEWLKIVKNETPWDWDFFYDTWFNPKHRKKVIKDAKI